MLNADNAMDVRNENETKKKVKQERKKKVLFSPSLLIFFFLPFHESEMVKDFV